MRLVPQSEALEKLSAIQSADAVGRQLAQDQAVEKLAGMAGVFMARDQSKEGLDKLAQSMVFAGELSSEEYEMLKEAGFAGLLAKKVGRKVKAKVTGAVARVGQRAAKVKARVTPRPKPTMQSRNWGTTGNVVPSRTRPVKARGAAQSRDWAGKVAPPTGPVRKPIPARATKAPVGPPTQAAVPGQVMPAQASPAMSEGRVVRRVRNAGVQPQKRAPVVEVRGQRGARTVGPAPQQSVGRVAPSQRAAPTQQPAGKVPPAAKEVAEKVVPEAVKETAKSQVQSTGQEASKGHGWGRALPWMGVGGLGYGLYKGVPWASRQLEQSSTMPMAYGGGWSPVPYGYGHSPYGSGVPTMGMGA